MCFLLSSHHWFACRMVGNPKADQGTVAGKGTRSKRKEQRSWNPSSKLAYKHCSPGVCICGSYYIVWVIGVFVMGRKETVMELKGGKHALSMVTTEHLSRGGNSSTTQANRQEATETVHSFLFPFERFPGSRDALSILSNMQLPPCCSLSNTCSKAITLQGL